MLCIVTRPMYNTKFTKVLCAWDKKTKIKGTVKICCLRNTLHSLYLPTASVGVSFRFFRLLLKENSRERMNSGCLQNLRTTNNVKSSLHDKWTCLLLSFTKMNKAEKQCIDSYHVCSFPDSHFRGCVRTYRQRTCVIQAEQRIRKQ